jgi:hypothetical protein
MAPNSGTQSAANPVALHRTAQHFAHGESHARASLVLAVTVIHGDVPGKVFFSFLVHGLKICVL